MGRTLYQHVVTMEFVGEKIERVIRATSTKKAIKSFKETYVDKDFLRRGEYKIEARLKPLGWKGSDYQGAED